MASERSERADRGRQHGEQRQRSQLPPRRIIGFEALSPEGARMDLAPGLTLQDGVRDGQFRLGGPGIYEVILHVDNSAISRLPADRLNAHLETEGLTIAARMRERAGRTGADGSERYGRVAKALIMVRSPDGASAYTGRPLGLPLEIVLERSPMDLSEERDLPIRVYYYSGPLAGALVDLVDLNDDAAPNDSRTTNAEGRVLFIAPRAGRWLLSVVWARAAPAADDVDFETWFSTLSFGFD